MDVRAETARIRAQLLEAADPARAVQEKRYMKSDLEFIGCGLGPIRAAAKQFAKSRKDISSKELWMIFDELWGDPAWEVRVSGVALLQHFVRLLDIEDLPRLRQLVVEASAWAINDWLGCHVVGSIVERDCHALAVMDAWAQDRNLWVRRVAMQSLLLSFRSTGLAQWPRFVAYAKPRLGEKDFWTRKVIGWVCREVSKTQPTAVFEFLSGNLNEVSGLTLREGGKYLSNDLRKKLGLKPVH